MDAERYEVQARLAQVGLSGQRRLAGSRVLIVGVGGIGCASAAYLAMSGIGTLRIADGDSVSLSNLGRQILYRAEDLGRPKAQVAARRLTEMNPQIAVEPIEAFADRTNFVSLLQEVDLVVDGTDSIAARRLLNRAFVTLGVPVVFGAAAGHSGSVLTCSASGPCYDCVWTEPPDAGCETAGVLGPLVGIVGTVQAAEALRTLLGFGTPGRLLAVDAFCPNWKTLILAKRPACPTCGRRQILGDLPNS